MLGLTVEETEVTQVADEMVARCQSRVAVMVGVSIAAFLVALAFFYLAARWFDRRFAQPMQQLHAHVERAIFVRSQLLAHLGYT